MDLYDDVPEVARCLNKLRMLFTQEAAQHLCAHIDDVSSFAHFNGLMSGTLLRLREPSDEFEHIKENLSYDPTIYLNIITATEEYNTAVTKQIAGRILARLPRKLRDLVYTFLTPGQIIVCTLRHSSCSGTLHVHSHHNKYGERWHEDRSSSVPGATNPYPPPFPRTERDRDCPQHVWSDAAMGVDKAHELMGRFYRTPTFDIQADTLTTALPSRILATVLSDRFGLGLPTADWISNIKLDLWVHTRIGLSNRPLAFQDKTISTWIEVLGSQRKNIRMGIVLRLYTRLGEIVLGETCLYTLDRLLKRMLPEIVSLRRDRPHFTITHAETVSDSEIGAAFKKWVNRVEAEHAREVIV